MLCFVLFADIGIMVFNGVLNYMFKKKNELQEKFWEEKELILKFSDNKFAWSGDAFIQGVWEVLLPDMKQVNAQGFYAVSDHFEIHKFGQYMFALLEKLPDPDSDTDPDPNLQADSESDSDSEGEFDIAND